MFSVLLMALLSDQFFEFSKLMKSHPGININYRVTYDGSGTSLLSEACDLGRIEFVKLLLLQPNIDVNTKNSHGQTPLMICCRQATICANLIRVLIDDPRVDVTSSDEYDRTPLWVVSSRGYLELVELFIASGKDLGDLGTNKMRSNQLDVTQYFSVAEIAKRNGNHDVSSLLERFIKDPILTRYELRIKFCMFDSVAAVMFAMAVFMCDGILCLKADSIIIDAKSRRFFSIIERMPMELQMIICRRVVGSSKNNILIKDSEPAFKILASHLLS